MKFSVLFIVFLLTGASLSGLRRRRGIAFDWGRGDPFSRVWTDDGRFYSRVLPFLAKHLIFVQN